MPWWQFNSFCFHCYVSPHTQELKLLEVLTESKLAFNPYTKKRAKKT